MIRARPDSFVLLAPVTWSLDQVDTLNQVHAETWQERAIYRIDATSPEASSQVLEGDESLRATGTIDFEEESYEGYLSVEPPMERLEEAVGTGKQPFQASEVALLEQHSAVWRIVLEGRDDEDDGVERALRAGRVMSTLVRAGAAAIFVPAIAEMHAPSFIREQTKGLAHEQSLVNLFIGAWDDEDWMTTRGLTCFGFPEIETPVEGGLNAAYFRLMDAASGMIARGSSFPIGARLEIGPASFEIEEGPRGPEDEHVPICGTFGVQTLQPR